jgi:hypothetical protein
LPNSGRNEENSSTNLATEVHVRLLCAYSMNMSFQSVLKFTSYIFSELVIPVTLKGQRYEYIKMDQWKGYLWKQPLQAGFVRNVP